MRHRLPVAPSLDVVDQIEISVPCSVPWDSMSGDDRRRHCGQCRQNVYNVAALTRAEAFRLLQRHSGRVCLRIFRRPDGTVTTTDCRTRLRAARKRGLLVFAGVLAIVLWAQICAQVVGLLNLRRLTCRSRGISAGPVVVSPRPRVPEPEPIMGEPALVPPPTMGAPPPPPPRATAGRVRVKAEPELLGKRAAR